MMNLKFIAALIATLLLSACGATSFKAESLNKVQNIAIISLDGELEESKNDAGIGLLGEIRKVKNTAKAYKGDADLSPKIYQLIVGKLHQDLNWDVSDITEVTHNATYKNLSDKYYSKMLPSIFQMPGLLRAEADRLSHQERQTLIQALGVDAIALVALDVAPYSETSIMESTSSTNYKARIDFKIYAKGEEEAVWKVTQLAGKTTDTKVRSWFGIAVKDEFSAAILSSVDNVLSKMVKQYQEAH